MTEWQLDDDFGIHMIRIHFVLLLQILSALPGYAAVGTVSAEKLQGLLSSQGKITVVDVRSSYV